MEGGILLRVCVYRNELRGSAIDFFVCKMLGLFSGGCGDNMAAEFKTESAGAIIKINPPLSLNITLCSSHPRSAGNSQPAHTRRTRFSHIKLFSKIHRLWLGVGAEIRRGVGELYNIDEFYPVNSAAVSIFPSLLIHRVLNWWFESSLPHIHVLI